MEIALPTQQIPGKRFETNLGIAFLGNCKVSFWEIYEWTLNAPEVCYSRRRACKCAPNATGKLTVEAMILDRFRFKCISVVRAKPISIFDLFSVFVCVAIWNALLRQIGIFFHPIFRHISCAGVFARATHIAIMCTCIRDIPGTGQM